ncbi:MAG TPA: beta-galactosidase GalA [Candidatus Saccharimonadales bacterium]|nr:beta-galactosidase GalA [Candidatus Saccharimonadales bacterium]
MKAITRAYQLLIVFSLIFATTNLFAADTSSPRQRLLMDFGWKFHLGNEWGIAQSLAKAGTGSGPASMSFSDASWRTVNLPHDWAVELPFDSNADAGHGFKPVGPGFPATSVAWYRRTFELPKSDEGKRLWLEFDGVYRDCDVFVNGWFVGHHNSGYDSFRYDITDVANYGGRNLIAVKVDASQFEGWFYEGAGIYRHVWLVKTSPVAISPDGVFIYSHFKNNVPEGVAEIHVQTHLLNTELTNVPVVVKCELVSPDGNSLGQAVSSGDLKPSSDGKLESEFFLCPPDQPVDFLVPTGDKLVFYSPELWSPENPKLYRLITTVESHRKIVDRKETEFGIRTVAFDPDKGFLLNGKPYELKGTCNHQDAAGIGEALPDALQYFRVKKLKEMGCNAIRTSHNAPTPELLDVCDQLGMLVMDENRLLGSDSANLARLRGQILRDRNHPSVVIWSIANEEFTVQDTPAGKRVAATMQNLIQRLDPTRPITYAAPVGNDYEKNINSVIEVRGWNYHVGKDMDDYHAEHPKQPEVGTEQGSTVSTRGIYANDPKHGYVSAYDTNAQPWSNTAERWWSYFAERPWLSGGFVWTGFDYRGEPTPYGWPCINSHFGIMDTCGFPKDLYYYYQSWWTDKPVLHLLPHWNWPGKEGQDIDVWCFSNCRQVELFLNGKSLGRKTMEPNSHLTWMVKYEPGALSAQGYDADGKLIATAKVETTGAPAAVQLEPDRASINADGEDVSVITVSVCDAQNRVVPVATNLVDFNLEGPGKIIGVGNGDPSCHEPDIYLASWPSQIVAINDDWRWERVTNVYDSNLREVQTDCDDSSWSKADPQSAIGPLEGRAQAVFRGKINITEQELDSESVELCFGMIDEDGWVYINGHKVGESHDWQSSPAFDVKRFLRPGENVIAVAVANWDGPGGINKGVTLRLTGKPEMPQWKRSVFNGLAQILVQSTKTPGEIKLTARAEGLSPATLVIHSQASTLRPYVP